MFELSYWDTVAGFIEGGILFYLGLCIYRLWFHSLAAFPGPWQARCSYLYEFYYDLWLPGQYTWKLRELHKQYGPILRINPDEIHINDPDFYDEVYNNSNAPIDKPYKESAAFGPYPAAIGTQEHNLHRIRRNPLNTFFSQRSVHQLLPHLYPVIENYCDRLEEAATSGEPIDIKYTINALTMDNITEYCFAKRPNQVLTPDFEKKQLDALEGFMAVSRWAVHFPRLMRPIHYIPDWLNRRLSPDMAGMLDLRIKSLGEQIEAIRSGQDVSAEKAGHRTIFYDLLESKSLPPSEMEINRLRDEALSLVTAGSVTVSHTMRGILYHIMANPLVHEKCVAAIKTVMPGRTDTPDLAKLETIPYLTAIISEGLRLTHPVSTRLRRTFPKKTLVYKSLPIPSGTCVGMSSILIHENEDIFPDPQSFNPDRWLDSSGKLTHLNRYLTTFSRGTRGCLGLNLAWAEMYVILATTFRRFKFDVSGVDRVRDVDVSIDNFAGAVDPRSRGMVVRVQRIE